MRVDIGDPSSGGILRRHHSLLDVLDAVACDGEGAHVLGQARRDADLAHAVLALVLERVEPKT